MRTTSTRRNIRLPVIAPMLALLALCCLGACGSPQALLPAHDDLGPLGSRAQDYLRASPFSHLVIEVDNVEGAEPTQEALNDLATLIEGYADKPGGVTFRGTDTFAASGTTYTLVQVQELVREYRDHYSEDDTVVMYFLYLNGEYENRDALGIAFNATSTAIFIDQIHGVSGGPMASHDIERALLTHEMGHLWSLVEIGYTSESDHDDADHPYHCTNTDCVMYFAVESINLPSIISGGPPDDFCAQCRADINFLGGTD